MVMKTHDFGGGVKFFGFWGSGFFTGLINK